MSSYSLEELGDVSYSLKDLGGEKKGYSLEDLAGPSEPMGPPKMTIKDIGDEAKDYSGRYKGASAALLGGIPKAAGAVMGGYAGLGELASGLFSGKGVDASVDEAVGAINKVSEATSKSVDSMIPKETQENAGYHAVNEQIPTRIADVTNWAVADPIAEAGFPATAAVASAGIQTAANAALPLSGGVKAARIPTPERLRGKEVPNPAKPDLSQALKEFTNPENVKKPVDAEALALKEEQRAFEREQRKAFSTDAEGNQIRVEAPPEVLYGDKKGSIAESPKVAKKTTYYKERAERLSEVQRLEAEAAELVDVGHADIAKQFKERARELKRQQSAADLGANGADMNMFVGATFGEGKFANMIALAERLGREGMSDRGVFKETKMYLTENGKGAKAISDKAAIINEKFTSDVVSNKTLTYDQFTTIKPNVGDVVTTAGEFFPHGVLYEGYPHLKDLPVVFNSNLPDGIYGQNHGNQGISLNPKYYPPELIKSGKMSIALLKDLKESMVHEIQHTIQNENGWPKGGSKRGHSKFVEKGLKALEVFQNRIATLEKNRPDLKWYVEQLKQERNKMSEHLSDMLDENRYYIHIAGEIQARLAQYLSHNSQAFLDSSFFDIKDFEPGTTGKPILTSKLDGYGGLSSDQAATPRDSHLTFAENTVRKLLYQSETFKEFNLRLSLASKDAGWQEHIVGRAADFWEHKDAALEGWIPNAYTGRKGEIFGSMEPITETIKRNIFEKNADGTLKLNKDGKPIVQTLLPKEDISGVHRTMQGSDNLFTQLRGRGGEIFRSVITNTELIVAESVKLFGEFKEGLTDYGNLSRVERRKMVETAAKYDGLNNQYLADNGLQWLPVEKLVEEGFNEKQITAYQSLTRVVDKAYDVINIAREKQGLEPIQRIPGFFPHTWHGRFKVRIYDDNGSMVGLKAFANRYTAQKFADIAKEEGLKTTGTDGLDVLQPDSKYNPINFVRSMNEALEVTNSRSKLDQVIRKRLASLENRQLQGFFKSELETANVAGYTKHFDKTIFGDSFKNMDLENIYTHYLEGVANYYKDVMLRKDVLAPVERATSLDNFQNTPNLRNAMVEYVSRNTETTHSWSLGEGIDYVTAVPVNAALAKTIGVPASTMGAFARGIMDYLYLTKLFLTARYGLSQFVQPVFFTNQLILSSLKLGDSVPRGSFGSAMKSFGEYYGRQSPDFRGSNEFVNEGIKWMQENGKLDVENATHVDSEVGVNLHNEGKRANVFSQTWKDTRDTTLNVGKTLKYNSELLKYGYERIEENNRRTVAAGMLAYYEKIVPGDRFAAYTAAVRAMDLTMGNYTKGHSAGVYQHAGWVGRNSKPFSTLRNMYYGTAYETLHFAAEQAKAKGYKSPETYKAMSAFLAMQVTYGLFAGMQGLVLYKEAEWAYEKLREWNPSQDWMPFAYYFRAVTDKMGNAAYGILGMATGADVGTSVGAPSATEGLILPGAGVVQAGADLAWTGIKQVFAEMPPPEEDFYKNMRKLAPNTPLFDPLVQLGKKVAPEHPMLGKGLQMATVQGVEGYYARGGVVPYPSRLEGMIERTPAQDRTYTLWGSQSLKEKQDRTDVYVTRAQRTIDANVRTSTVKKIADSMLGLTDVDPGDAIVKAMEKGMVGSKKDLEKAVAREIKERGLPQIQKDLARMAQTNPQRAARAYKLMEQMGAFKE